MTLTELAELLRITPEQLRDVAAAYDPEALRKLWLLQQQAQGLVH